MTLHIGGNVNLVVPISYDPEGKSPNSRVKPRCCLLLHGFTGGPYEIMPLAKHLRKQGIHCHVPTLPGHDKDLKGLGVVTWRDWLDAAASEADKLTRQFGEIDVVGFSMGGLISAYLANRFPVHRLVLLNAAVIYLSRFINDLAERLRCRDWDHLLRVTNTPLPAAFQFMKLARYTRLRELPRISVPTLIAQGKKDQIVHPRSAEYIYHRLRGERELIYFPNSRHMICMEQEAPELFAAVEHFLNVSK
ncbi:MULTISPECIES: alpha/beta fold hydrolase [unclassified Paenibacillus]|uniref:alpha/beta hydrolase n=1 Tax=unclassified Paenibacillus TaxID=185978 RepID=UPI001AE7C5D4|nr:MULTISPECIES: alpha/beta fold hydrolase [unclassified Paenibacillus]MBP1155443.1 esterase/lipase [Paenibacillus sp. PvP091]MBP1169172.1 esterase/lipase [Paenibacillus sp. PvR098]MBP2440200.1 esterase/lipase [Paenibacillus sp. PvP052]